MKGRSFLPGISPGGEAGDALEHFGKMEHVGIAHAGGNVGEGAVVALQKLLGPFNAQAVQILYGGNAKGGGEELAEIHGAERGQGGKEEKSGKGGNGDVR